MIPNIHNKSLSVSFSGHREIRPPQQHSLFGEKTEYTGVNSEYIGVIKEKIRNAVTELCNKGYKYFFCGMAEGFDLLAGEVVLELKATYPDIELIAVIPFPKQAVGFSPESKATYEYILSNASYSTTVCPTYSYDCFHKRNDYMVDNSEVLVCLFNGSKGGTEYTVKRALTKGLRVINTYDI